MEAGESVDSMQTRFLHLINKLRDLGKIFSNKDCTNKILDPYAGSGNQKSLQLNKQMILVLWTLQNCLGS